MHTGYPPRDLDLEDARRLAQRFEVRLPEPFSKGTSSRRWRRPLIAGDPLAQQVADVWTPRALCERLFIRRIGGWRRSCFSITSAG